MGGALAGMAAGGGMGSLASGLLSRTKTGQILGSLGGGGATPNPFSGLLADASTRGNVSPLNTSVPTPTDTFSQLAPPSSAYPGRQAGQGPQAPQVSSPTFLQPPPTAQDAVSQTRSRGGTPNANEAFAFNYLRGKELSPVAAAGIVGNLATESSFANDVLTGQRRGDKGASAFAAQWQGPRLTNLIQFAGTETPSFQQQLDFIFEEANPDSAYYDVGAARAMRMINDAPNPAIAADIFRDHFERPSAPDRGVRRGHAQRAFQQFGGGSPLSVSGAGTAGAGAGGPGGVGGALTTGASGFAGAGAGAAANGFVVIGGVRRQPPVGRFSQAPLPPGLFNSIEQAKLGGAGGDFALGGAQVQAGGGEQQELSQPVDLATQEIGGIQQGLTQKRLGEQRESRASQRKEELKKKIGR